MRMKTGVRTRKDHDSGRGSGSGQELNRSKDTRKDEGLNEDPNDEDPKFNEDTNHICHWRTFRGVGLSKRFLSTISTFIRPFSLTFRWF